MHIDPTFEPPPLPPPIPSSRRGTPAPRRLPKPPWRLLMLWAVVVGLPLWIWFGWRIEPRPGQVAVLIRKTGAPLPSGEILAISPRHKGIQPEVLPEGRYFRNPWTWSWEYHPVVTIPAGRLGVQVRLHGREPENGRILAGDGEKGILPEILSPGTYRINPYAIHVEQFDAISIRPGRVGVVVSLVGADPLDVALTNANTFLVERGRKGVLAEVLDPGTHYLNPYMYNVVEVNLQSQRFEMSGEDAISFLTSDGFIVEVEGTLEFSIQREQAALLTHQVGDMDDIVKKLILPRARGFSRIEGSKQPATSFIMGETRQQFQNTLETHLRERCRDWGVAIKSVLIRNIRVPDEIASVIREREIAVQEARKFEQQIEQARSKAELTRQEMLAEQNKARVDADTQRLKAVIEARQTQSVNVTNALRGLEVATIELDAARFRAAAMLAEATGQAEVIRMDNEARAEVLRRQVDAFGGGLTFARYTFYESLAPRLETLMTTDDAEGFGGLLRTLLSPPLPAGGGTAAEERR
ncbi:MAG: SPFH domain-containing protein [Kiritimatiellae bacterium]|nr:SPFH domain-containing protein [Kiritimatiellia bacterium]